MMIRPHASIASDGRILFTAFSPSPAPRRRRLRLCAADAPRPERAGFQSDAPRPGSNDLLRTAAAHRVAPYNLAEHAATKSAFSGLFARPATRSSSHHGHRLAARFVDSLYAFARRGIAPTSEWTPRGRVSPDVLMGRWTDRPGPDALPADRYGRNHDARNTGTGMRGQRDRGVAAAGRSHRSRREHLAWLRFRCAASGTSASASSPFLHSPAFGNGRSNWPTTAATTKAYAELEPSGTKELAPGTGGGALLRHGADRRTGRTGKSAPSSTTRARPSPTCKPERAPTSRSTTSRCGSFRAQRPRTRLALHAAHARRCAACKSGARILTSSAATAINRAVVNDLAVRNRLRLWTTAVTSLLLVTFAAAFANALRQRRRLQHSRRQLALTNAELREKNRQLTRMSDRVRDINAALVDSNRIRIVTCASTSTSPSTISRGWYDLRRMICRQAKPKVPKR